MKRSHTILLTLVGVLTSACEEGSSGPMVQARDRYASKADCLADWNTEADCQEVTDEQQRRVWLGPYYYYFLARALHGGAPLANAPRPDSRALATMRGTVDPASVPRGARILNPGGRAGGFGATGRSYGGGGWS